MKILQPRNVKPRTEAAGQALGAHETERPPNYEKYAGLSISSWLTNEGSAMRRRAVLIEEGKEAVMRDGHDGWRHHWRHGMIGAVQYWAAGCRANVVAMLVGLASVFGVGSDVAKHFSPDRDTHAAQLAVGSNVKRAVQGLKLGGGTCFEEQWRERHILLAAAFGPPAKVNDPRGMTTKIGKYLEVPVGARYTKNADGSTTKREYASRKAQTTCATFEAEVQRQITEAKRPVQVGDVVLSRGEQAELVRFMPDGGCILRMRGQQGDNTIEMQFSSLFSSEHDAPTPASCACLSMPPLLQVGDDVISHGDRAEITSLLANGGCILTFQAVSGHCEQKTYRWRFGKAEGSARLQRPPPLLLPGDRKDRSDRISASTRLLVSDHAKEVCMLSPCKRDEVKRHTAPRVWESRQVAHLEYDPHLLSVLDARHSHSASCPLMPGHDARAVAIATTNSLSVEMTRDLVCITRHSL